jgi:hypothetical protein
MIDALAEWYVSADDDYSLQLIILFLMSLTTLIMLFTMPIWALPYLIYKIFRRK